MWHDIIIAFLGSLAGGSIVCAYAWLTGRWRFSKTLLIVSMCTVANLVPRIIFGYFPQLDTSWVRFAVIIGIAFLIALPYPFLAQHLRRKDTHNA
jgi:hypothetical protein